MTTPDPTSHSPFHALHVAGQPLILANVWDVASARVVEQSGAPALATTSAGIAWSLGYSDGNHLPRAEALAAVRRIVERVRVPVTIDLEGGYGLDPSDTARTVSAALDCGVAGVNLEDGTRDPNEFAAHLRAARAAAHSTERPLFINARTDLFLAGGATEPDLAHEAISRAALYAEAGADGFFVPGAASAHVIRRLAEAVELPLNVMVGPGAPTVSELAGLGVARISLGSSIAQAAYGAVERAASEIARTGTYGSVADGIDYGTLNALSGAPSRSEQQQSHQQCL